MNKKISIAVLETIKWCTARTFSLAEVLVYLAVAAYIREGHSTWWVLSFFVVISINYFVFSMAEAIRDTIK